MNDRWIAEVQAYDPTNSIVTTLYFGTQGFTSAPQGVTVPAVAGEPVSEYYAPILASPGNLSRSMFAGPATTRGASRVGLGDIVLKNGDGALSYLRTWGLDGRTITVKRTETYKMNPTYSDFSTVFVATMQQAEVGRDEVRIKLRDLRYSLKQPLQTTKYAGSGLGTLEGSTDIKDKEKPVCYGAPHNVTPVCVETAKLIYQVHDAALQSIDAVYDRGNSLQVGLIWTSQSSGFGADGSASVAFGNGLFVTVGTSGKLATSTDGITWTLRTSTFGATKINNAAYGNGLWVIVGASGTMATSPDGITWTSRTSGFGATDISGVAYSPDLNLWVLAGAAGTMKTATDPTNNSWSTPTSGFGAVQINSVQWGNGLFVAVGGATGGSSGLTTSPDGITWTLRTSTFSATSAIAGAAYGDGTWVVVGNSGDMARSSDGKTWTSVDTPVVNNFLGLQFGNGLFVAGSDTGEMVTSIDGVVWTSRDPGFGGGNAVEATAFGNGVFVIAGIAGAMTVSTAAAGVYANSADLLSNDPTKVPAPGTYKVFLDSTGSYFRLGATPSGQITCDPVEGANAAARTAGQIFAKLLLRKSITAYAADVTALDTANAAVLGFYQGPEPVNVDECCDDVLGSIGASWYIDASGNFRSVVFTGPAATTVRDFTAHDLKLIERAPTTDPGAGIPAWRATVFYDRNYTVQTSDIAGAVTVDRRNFLAQEWRTAKDSDSAVLTKHLLSPEFMMESLLTSSTAAGTEATRNLTLRKAERDRFRLEVELRDENLVADLATTISVQHAMTGGTLAAPETHRYVVLGSELITDNPQDRRLALSVWGPEG